MTLLGASDVRAQSTCTVNGQPCAGVASDGQPAISAQALPATRPTPTADTLLGTSGTAALGVPGSDASRPTAVQRAIPTTDASGNWSITWARPFSVPPALSVKPIMPTATRGDCGVTSSTSATGTCWTYQTTVVSLLGASVSPIATTAAGVSVMVVAGTPTQ